MGDPLLLYSTNTWLTYVIGERFYRDEHYVWCTPDFDARALAEKIISEISLTEQRSVPGLGRARIDYYICKIAEIVQDRVRDTVGIDAERGDALLAELRSERR